MQYISPNNEYPRFYGDIQIENPDWKLGDPLPNGWIQVDFSEYPSAAEYEIVEEGFPVEKNGKFVQNWVKREMTAEEKERFDAPKKAKEKLLALGLTQIEIEAITRGLVR